MSGVARKPANRKVTIIGAGFSGLASAYYLVRAGFDVEIFEEQARVGGLISTRHTQHGLVESAANGFLNSTLVEDLFRDLRVPLVGASKEARKRYIYRDGRPRRWPLGFVGSLHMVWFGIRYLLFRASVAPQEGESVSAWGVRVLGREASQYLVDTALQGIYAGDTTRMSARLIFARLFRPRHKSRRPSIRGTVSAHEGMGQLIAALEKDLREKGVRIHLGTRGEIANGHPTIVATSATAAAAVVGDERAKLLTEVELRPVTTTTAFFSHTDEKSIGFGVLFPPVEKRKFLGVLKNTFVFPNRGRFSETWIRAGVSDPVEEIVNERELVFGLKERPVEAVVTKWAGAIPHYTFQLEKAIPALDRPVNNVFLMGNYLGDLGLARILERAARWPERLASEGRWNT